MTYCCSVFPKIAKRFEWMYSTRTDNFIFPIIVNHTTHDQGIINFCPHCGKDIRGIVISKEEFDKLK